MDQHFEMIEKYIDGDLKGKELIDFEKLLADDINIKHDYQLSMKINNSIAEDDVMALRETLTNIVSNNKVRRLPNVTKGRKLYYAAASIALLILAGNLLQNFFNPAMNNNVLYDKYYNPYDITVTYRSGNEKIDKLLYQAMERYDEKDFENALVIFEEVLASRKDDMAVNLYTGISYMEKENYKKAANSFTNIISDNNNLFVEQAKWYLAMCYIKTNDNGKAKEVLINLIKEETAYKYQASAVLKEIE